jgi:magnesium chelatase family protein
MDARLTRRNIRLGPELKERLVECHRKMSLTARGHDRVLRLARTIADLDGRDRVEPRDVDEAVGYRLAPETRAAA